MEHIVPEARLEMIPLTFQAMVLTSKPLNIADFVILTMPICLRLSLPERSVQATAVALPRIANSGNGLYT